MTATNPHVWWYLARAGGLVAWWTASASVLWGLLLSARLIRRRGAPAWLLALHRQLGALTVACTAVHVGGLVADSYVHFGWREVLVPFASAWHPAAVAWGVIAMYLLLAVETTSLLIKRLPRRLWRAIHAWSVLVFVLGTAHALSAGTDRTNLAVAGSGLFGATAFVFLLTFRRLADRTRPRTPQPSGAAS